MRASKIIAFQGCIPDFRSGGGGGAPLINRMFFPPKMGQLWPVPNLRIEHTIKLSVKSLKFDHQNSSYRAVSQTQNPALNKASLNGHKFSSVGPITLIL